MSNVTGMTVMVFDPFTVALTCTQAFLFFLSFLVVVVLFFFFFLEGGEGKRSFTGKA